GRIERRLLARGSKSEHQGLVLVDEADGQAWPLRRRQGPAFGDQELAALEGQRVQVTGHLVDRLLLIDRWRRLD
ncbi:MAG: hypothetical protein RL722_1221, partial [Pseudomonadota bacterium]